MSKTIKEIRIEEIMTKEVITVKEKDTLSEFKDCFSKRMIHHVIVENDEGKVSGIISSSDISNVLSWAYDDKIIAEQIMSKNVETIRPKATIKSALDIFLENRIRALPVADKKNQLLGIITPYDILKTI